VNCVNVGRKSGRVLASGGEDKLVTLWAIGKTEQIMSLSGHSSPVECVSFDNQEQLVVAGAASGTIKLWDLDQQKVVRTLTGHKANCSAVDFHPFGPSFFASGSVDTNLKIWDIRKYSILISILHYYPHTYYILQIPILYSITILISIPILHYHPHTYFYTP
jgi:katanin p80 WD40 repeat-containing subunit B1